MKHTRNPASRSCNRGEELVSRARAAGAGKAVHLERERSAGGRARERGQESRRGPRGPALGGREEARFIDLYVASNGSQ